MKTKQAIFLLGVNIISLIISFSFFERFQTSFIHLMQTLAVEGVSGAGAFSLFKTSIQFNGQGDYVTETIINYPVIFAYWFAGVNILFILSFLLWNKIRTK